MPAVYDIYIYVLGKFVTVVGNVVRVSGISAMVLKASFACPKCGCEQTRQFVDGKYNPPTSCAGANCKARVSKGRRGRRISFNCDCLSLFFSGGGLQPHHLLRRRQLQGKSK